MKQYNPSGIVYNSASDFTFEHELSEANFQKVSEKILKVDQRLKKFGFSRELVCRVMQSEFLREKYGKLQEVERKLSIVEKQKRKYYNFMDYPIEMEMAVLPVMKNSDRSEFLFKSGYRTNQKKMTSSISLRELVEYLQEQVKEYAPNREDEFIHDFLKQVDHQIEDLDFEQTILELSYDEDEQARISQIGEETPLQKKIREEKEKAASAQK